MDRWIFRSSTPASTDNSGLPPVVPQQVSQFLLDRRYYLTALQLLTESIKHGRESEVKNLQDFFTDADKFPANLPTKSQNHYVLDLQARMKEQEEKLQLAEYELRLSREDVSSLKSQLKQAEQALEAKSSVNNIQTDFESELANATPSSQQACSLQPASPMFQATGGLILSSKDGEEHSEGEPTASQLQELNAAVTAHLLSQGYRFTALSLQEEADVQVNWNPANGNPLWNLYCKAQAAPVSAKAPDAESECPSVCLQTASSSESVPSPTSSSPNGYHEEEQVLRQQLQEAQAQICELQEQVRGLQDAAAEALAAQASATFSEGDADHDDTALTGADTAQQRDQGDLTLSDKVDIGDSSAAVAAGVDLMKMVTEVLPKLSSNLTIKSRQELIPLLQAVITYHPDEALQLTNLTLLFNLVSSPDSAQREAIIRACVELANTLGSDWAAAQLLPLCVKALSNQSAERRGLCVELTNALLPTLDISAQFEVIISILAHLASDRIPAVRECVVLTAKGLLERLPFLRHCYSQLEELLFELVKDTEESVAAAVLGSFLPTLLQWLKPTDITATQLLPRTISTLQSLLRSPPSSASRPSHRRRSTHGSVDFSTDEEMLLFSADQSPPLEGHYVQARQLVHVLLLQLPDLGLAIRQTAPAWAYASPVRSSPVILPITIPDDTLKADQGTDADVSEDDRSPMPAKSSNAKMSDLRIQKPMNSAFTNSPRSSPSSPMRTPKSLGPSLLHPLQSMSTPPITNLPDGTQPDLTTWLLVGEQWRMWRVLSWCLQSMVPQLVSIMLCMAPLHEVLTLRLLVAGALREICTLLGVPLTTQAILPMLAVASASAALPADSTSILTPPTSPLPNTVDWSVIPRHVQELASQLAPATEDETSLARQRVLPFVMGVVLPEAGAGCLQSFMHALMEPPTSDSTSCWLLDHRGDVKVAVRFAAGFESARADLLELLSHLVHGESITKTMCGVALAQALAPCVPAPVLSQSVLPALMTLLGAGDREIKTASIAALGDVSRQLSIAPPDGDMQVAVSCQQKIHAIFDHLIQDGGHELQLCVLRTLSKVTTLDERLAGKGMLAQLEYLMQKLQFVLVQMQVSLSKQRSPDELRELASLLLCILQATFTCEVKDPKTQAYMSAALQSMQTQRHLLDEPQQESLNVMAQAQGSVAASAYTTLPHPAPVAAPSVPPLPTTSIASHRPHDPLNAPEVLKSVGAVVSSKLVSRFRSGWRNRNAAAPETPKSTTDSFFDE